MTNKEARLSRAAVIKDQVSATVLGYMDLLLEHGVYTNPEDVLEAAIRLESRLHQNPLSKSTDYFVNDFSDTYLSSKEDL